ncbi:hypothetical protein DPMN_011084 [Dreissena polymorpha]|uniref:Uncharacterized protein n=1 Tax=Dreissena polymorpha TaxID=45954 RepID=A0A9D4RZN2_DREPO|nr:hypothetical protein DPMN_011084 [Dreissena polymorpha]
MSFVGKPFVYSVSGEEHVWCSSDVRVLVAGDSNVHRLKSACPPNTRIDFPPVSETQEDGSQDW